MILVVVVGYDSDVVAGDGCGSRSYSGHWSFLCVMIRWLLMVVFVGWKWWCVVAEVVVDGVVVTSWWCLR